MSILIFSGGEAPKPELAENFFQEIKAKKNYIIAADSGIQTFEAYQSHFCDLGLVPNLILGDWDSIGDKSILEKYPKEIIKTHIVDKDFTDTELAMSEAKKLFENSCEDVHKIILIGASGVNRIDHLLSVFDLFASALRPDVWLSGRQFLYPARKFTVLKSTTWFRSYARQKAARREKSFRMAFCGNQAFSEKKGFRAFPTGFHPSFSKRDCPSN